jgi:hypothetical protein
MSVLLGSCRRTRGTLARIRSHGSVAQQPALFFTYEPIAET